MEAPVTNVPAVPQANRHALIEALTTVEGKVAAAVVTLSALVAIVEKITGWFAQLSKLPQPWPWLILAILSALGIIQYARIVYRRRRAPTATVTTAFIGAEPFRQQDKSRFFGRKAEITDITRKLTDPDVRFYILYGQSGCGKTSLVRAGLIPELESEANGMRCLYVRFYDKPEESLLTAFRLEGSEDTETGAKEAGRPELLAQLRLLLAADKRPTIIFIDQFEEFFTANVDPSERERVLWFLAECINSSDRYLPRIVFSLRRDFFDCMTQLESHVADVFRQPNRRRIDPFNAALARYVIEESLKHDGVQWTEDLIAKVIDDLQIVISDGSGGQHEPIVLPAELQIVCQMVQRRSLGDVRKYPGKQRLLSDYVSDAIETSPNRDTARRVLACLIHQNGITRSHPKTAAEVAQAITNGEVALVGRHLHYLDKTCRLLNEVRRVETDGTSVSAYELAHEYLVGIINQLTGTVIDETRRANILLQEYRNRSVALDRSLRIPIRDARLIEKHTSQPLTADDRRLLRRSYYAFSASVVGFILLPLATIVTFRQGTLHLAKHHRDRAAYVTLKVGLPSLAPLLGSGTIMLDTGLDRSEFDETLHPEIDSNLWLWGPVDSKRWDERLRKSHVAYLAKELADLSQEDYVDDNASPMTVPETLLALGAHHDAVKADLFKRLKHDPDFTGMSFRQVIDRLINDLKVDRATVVAEMKRNLVDPDVGDALVGELIRLGEVDKATLEAVDRFGLESAPIATGSDEVGVPARLARVSLIKQRWHFPVLKEHLAKQPYPEWLLPMLRKSVASRITTTAAAAMDMLSAIPSEREELTKTLRAIVAADQAFPRSTYIPGPSVSLIAADRLLRLSPSDEKAILFTLRALESSVDALMVTEMISERQVLDERVVNKLLEQVSQLPSADVRMYTLVSLGNRDEKVMGALRRELASKDSDVALTVASRLISLGIEKDAVHERLMIIARDKNMGQAMVAARLLWKIGLPRETAKEILMKGVRDGRQGSLRFATETLIEMDVDRNELIAAVRARLSGKGADPASAAAMLAKLDARDTASIEALRTAIDDDDDEVPRSVSTAFAKLALVLPKEGFESACARLTAELRSKSAVRSAAYRRSVEVALAETAATQRRAGGDSSIDPLLKRLEEIRKTGLLHEQLAASRVAYAIRDARYDRISEL